MKYPTLEEVEKAGHEQLARWSRFLPSPGHHAEWDKDFEATLNREVEVQAAIHKRFYGEFGGWNSALSKRIGWVA